MPQFTRGRSNLGGISGSGKNGTGDTGNRTRITTMKIVAPATVFTLHNTQQHDTHIAHSSFSSCRVGLGVGSTCAYIYNVYDEITRGGERK
jgi:hypothetical protein